MLAVTTGIALSVGIVLVATIYFYWQWYHTLRQSWGVAQLYRRRSPVPVGDPPMLAEGLFTLVALWGLLHRLTTAPEYFLFPSLPIAVPHVPVWFADGVGVLAVVGLAYWGSCAVARMDGGPALPSPIRFFRPAISRSSSSATW